MSNIISIDILLWLSLTILGMTQNTFEVLMNETNCTGPGAVEVRCAFINNKLNCSYIEREYYIRSSQTQGADLYIECNHISDSIGNKTRTTGLIKDSFTRYELYQSPGCDCMNDFCTGNNDACEVIKCQRIADCSCRGYYFNRTFEAWDEDHDMWVKSDYVNITVCDNTSVTEENLNSGGKIPKAIFLHLVEHFGWDKNKFDEYVYEDYDLSPSEGLKRQHSTSFSWEIPLLRIFSDKYSARRIEVHKEGMSQVKACEETHCEVEIENRFFRTAGVIVFHFIEGVNLIYNNEISITEAQLICEKPTCNYCTEYLKNLNCYTSTERRDAIAFIMINAIFALLAVIVIIFFVWKFYCVCIKENNDINVNIIRPELCLLLCLLVVPSSAVLTSSNCNAISTINSHEVDCTYRDGVENCNYTLVSNIVLQHIGSKACLEIKNKDGSHLTTIEAEFKSSNIYKDLDLLYYTSHWHPITSSRRLCAYTWVSGDNRCGLTQDCSTNFGTNAGMNVLTDFTIFKPGRSFCENGPGCVNNGCFSCDPSCIYGRWAISAHNDAYGVYDTSSEVHINTVQLCRVEDKRLCADYVLTKGNQAIGTNFILSYNGQYVAPAHDIKPFKLLLNTDRTEMPHLVTAAGRGFPQPSQIGDIQAGSKFELSGTTVSNFVFARDLCHESQAGNNLKFTCVNDALGYWLNQKDNSHQLPTSHAGVTWTYSANKLWASDPNPGSISLTLETKSDVDVVRVFTEICPKAEFISITGCFSCDLETYIVIEAMSTCLEGQAVVSSETLNIISESISLTRDKQRFHINFKSDQEHLNDKIIITGSAGHKTELIVKGTLEHPHVELFDTGTKSYINSSNPIDRIHGWSWSKKLGLTVGTTLGAIALALFLMWFISLVLPLITKCIKYEKLSPTPQVSNSRDNTVQTSDSDLGMFVV